MKTSIIILAAGKGERFGRPKSTVVLGFQTLLERCLETVQGLPFEKEIVIVTPEIGGATRLESVQIGLKKCRGDIVLIHNVANPLATAEDFLRVREILLERNAAVFVGQRISDTLRRMDAERSVTINREGIWRVQTPQGFRREQLTTALASPEKKDITDEIQLFESTNIPIVALETSQRNQKLTYPQDLLWMEQMLASDVRFGIGEDSHAFDEQGTLVLAGVPIESCPKLKANSDGDLILHALFNAISSALGGGSIGATADAMAGKGIANSQEYLKPLLRELKEQGLMIHHVAVSLEAKRPRLDPLELQLKKSLAGILEIPVEKIGMTATSGEGLSSFGKGEGMRCQCVVSVGRIF